MLKAVANDGKLVIFGLSHQNLDRLRHGEPIMVDAKEMGLNADTILIFSGRTEETMSHEFEELIGPKTKVHISPRLKS